MKKVEISAPRKISVLYPLQSIAGPTDYEKKTIRVVAYCRVSTGSEVQLVSYRAQVKYYESYIRERPEYIFSGIYADEGISGTDLNSYSAEIGLLIKDLI